MGWSGPDYVLRAPEDDAVAQGSYFGVYSLSQDMQLFVIHAALCNS